MTPTQTIRVTMNQAIIDAAAEVFQLGPEHEDELLRFGMKLQDMEDQERQQEPVSKVDSAVTRIREYLEKNPVRAREAWDKIAKKADDDFAAFMAQLSPERRTEILEESSDRTLRKHFHSSPTFDELERMWLENDIREVYLENKKLKATPKEVRGLSVEQAKDLLRAINAGAWERIDGALRVNAVSQEHVTQCFKDLGIELEPPF